MYRPLRGRRSLRVNYPWRKRPISASPSRTWRYAKPRQKQNAGRVRLRRNSRLRGQKKRSLNNYSANMISTTYIKASRRWCCVGLMLLLSGCSTTSLMRSETLKSPVICPPPPSLDNYQPREVVWVETEEVNTRLKVFGLTPKHYENLAHNQAAQKRAFRQAI